MTVNPIRHPVGNARKPRKPEPIARPAALGELLLKRLRDDIVSGVFALGERLSEEQISRHYGITRAPVRPTLIKLQSEGLLQILPQRGAFVLDPTPEEVRELCELRTALELEAARLALRRSAVRPEASGSLINSATKAAISAAIADMARASASRAPLPTGGTNKSDRRSR